MRNMASSNKYLVLAALVVVSLLVESTVGLHQIIRQNEKKCYLEEVPRDTLVLVNFKGTDMTRSQIEQAENPLGFNIIVTDPNGDQPYQKLHGLKGRAAFTSAVGGEYEICLQTNASRWFGGGINIKLEVDIETGSDAVDYDELAQAEHLTELQTEVRRLNDQAREIIKEQSYLKNREAEARDEAESINSRVVFWSVAETVLLILSGVWQIRHLKQFFRQKKLV